MGTSATVALGLGSNAAWGGMDSLALLGRACAMLRPLFRSLALSSVYRTKPMYLERQADFLNMVAAGVPSDGLTPLALLSEIHRIEAALGRDRAREVRNGPRPIDIDVELFGLRSVLDDGLVVPHPRLRERAFVCVPLWEVAPGLAEAAGLPRFDGCADVSLFAPPFDLAGL